MIKGLCIWIYKKNQLSIHDAVVKLKEVCTMQQELIDKYDNEIDVVRRQCRIAINNKASKSQKLYYIKKIKIIEYHQESLRKRLLACTEKQYHLESMQLTVNHIDAIKMASNTLKQFMKQTDIEKVEKLQENMSDLIADAMEIQTIVSENVNQQHDWADEDLEKELEALNNDETLWPDIPLVTPNQSNDIETNGTDSSTPLMTYSEKTQDYRKISTVELA